MQLVNQNQKESTFKKDKTKIDYNPNKLFILVQSLDLTSLNMIKNKKNTIKLTMCVLYTVQVQSLFSPTNSATSRIHFFYQLLIGIANPF